MVTITNEYDYKKAESPDKQSGLEITPEEIIESFYPLKNTNDINHHYYYEVRCYSETAKKIAKYGNRKCVIAYMINSLGSVFILKSRRFYFAFSVKNNILGKPYDYNSIELDLLRVIKFLDSSPETKILNQTEYERLKKIMLAKSIRGEVK